MSKVNSKFEELPSVEQKIFAFFKNLFSTVYFGLWIVLPEFIWDVFVNRTPKLPWEEMTKRSDQVAVLTGGPTGIAHDIVKNLLKLDYTVVLGVRNVEVSEKAIDSIRADGISSGQVVFLKLDLKSLRSVRQFANQILTKMSRIDLLLNNAGIGTVGYEQTEDGYESIFQVNYLGHFLLTNILLPRINDTAKEKNGYCHILHTASVAHHDGNVDLEEFENCKPYMFSEARRYWDSKLYIVMGANYLQRQVDGEKNHVFVYSCHPGVIPTNIWNGNKFTKFVNKFWKHVGRSTAEAANAILSPVFAPKYAENQGGLYFENGKAVKPNPLADDIFVQEQVWKKSCELVGLKFKKN